jgi:molecular chaperone DnaK
LKDYGDKISSEVRGQIESAVSNLKDALKSDEGDRIKKAVDNLNAASHKLAEEMYKSAPQGGATPGPEASTDRGAAGAAEGGPKKDDDVIDAEYEVK